MPPETSSSAIVADEHTNARKLAPERISQAPMSAMSAAAGKMTGQMSST